MPRPNREALVCSGPFLLSRLRANCKDEQPKPEQHECAVQARVLDVVVPAHAVFTLLLSLHFNPCDREPPSNHT